YEESGWYDGQVWIKPPEVLLQDRLIGTYEIYPGLLRLQMTVSSLLVIFILGVTLITKT
ncbi:MAG: CGLD27 family protein, partial [Synechococcus sp.]